MRSFRVLLVANILSISLLLVTNNYGQSGSQVQVLAAQAKESIKKGITFFHSINIEGGYVYHYSIDLKEKWGEGKTDDYTIEVQPPGTPAVGMTYLRANRILNDPEVLQAARDAGDALIRGQNTLGGWEHKIYFNKPKGRRVSFDDDQTQSAISFLMALDQEVDSEVLSKGIDRALDMMIKSQLENGAWPHRYPADGSYHDFATFNDQGINDCIRVMIEASRFYNREDCRMSLDKVGRFLIISQLPPPQSGWAQQYNEYLQPAWARSFEPPSVCTQVTIANLFSLLDLYEFTREFIYLEPIPDAIRWLEESRLKNGKWGRFLELGTNKALYYDRDRIRVDSIEDLSLERRTGYGYQIDISDRLEEAKARFYQLWKKETKVINGESYDQQVKNLIPLINEILNSQDDQGRWIVKDDRFRKEMSLRKWNGEYRTEDRISSQLFNHNINTLCKFLELIEITDP